MKKELTPPKTTYSIVIPAYSEGEYIGATLQELADYLNDKSINKQTEIIVICADSADNTEQIARQQEKNFNQFTVITPGPKVGKGRDLRAGMQKAKGQFVLFMDADRATPLHHIMPFFEILASGEADIVIGTRSLSTMHSQFVRKAVSLGTNTLIRLFIDRSVADSQCGFKAFTQKSVKTIFSRSVIDGWGIDFEVIYIARIHKLNIAQIPVTDWKDPKDEDGLAGESKISATIKTLKELILVRKYAHRGIYS